MLRIEPIKRLEAGATTTTSITYDPVGVADAAVELSASTGIRIVSVTAALLSGETITSRIEPRPNGLSVEVGVVEVPVVVTACVRADIPSSVDKAKLTVRVGQEQARMSFEIFGEPRFLGPRCRLILSANELHPGGIGTLRLSCVNDGSAVARDVRLYLRSPMGVTMEAPAGCWREVDAQGDRHLVLPVESIAIGERASREVTVQVAPTAADGTGVTFEGWIAVGGQRFALDGAVLRVRSSARAVGGIRVVDSRSYRYGDRVTAIAWVKSRGTDIAHDVCLHVSGSGIAWEGGGRDGALSLTFGDLAPFTQASRSVEGVVVGSPAGKRHVQLSPRGVAAFGSFPAEGTSITVAGASRVVSTLAISGPDASSAHTVELRVANVGDGVARSVRVVAEPIEGVVGVVDSLSVDGRGRLELDGSLGIDRGGLDLGALQIRTERRVRWRVRSASAQRVVLRVRVDVDGNALTAQADVPLVAGRNRAPWAPAIDASEPTDVVGITELIALQPLAAHQPVEKIPVSEAGASDEQLGGPDRADARRDGDTGSPRLEYDLPARAPARWRAWFGEAGPQADTPLGMHALALREFLPVAAPSAAADAALAGIRSEAEAVVQARLESFKVLAVFGASGCDFTTARLRSALVTLYGVLERPLGEPDGLGLERAICAVTGADGTALAEPVARYRDAVLSALDAADEISALGDAAPAVMPSARALFDRLVEVAVR